jgi:small subunit ribosomal protein S8e
VHIKKRLFESGRPAAMTKIGPKRVHEVRVRGGNVKQRALRLDTGNFSWGSEVATRKARVVDVVYNASNNELVRTKTLVKGCIVQIESLPFRNWYESHYGVKIGMRKGKRAEEEDVKKSHSLTKKFASRQQKRALDPLLDDQFASGRLLAAVSSRPGQSGRCDGYILEGKELEFYQKMLKRKGK